MLVSPIGEPLSIGFINQGRKTFDSMRWTKSFVDLVSPSYSIHSKNKKPLTKSPERNAENQKLSAEPYLVAPFMTS